MDSGKGIRWTLSRGNDILSITTAAMNFTNIVALLFITQTAIKTDLGEHYYVKKNHGNVRFIYSNAHGEY